MADKGNMFSAMAEKRKADQVTMEKELRGNGSSSGKQIVMLKIEDLANDPRNVYLFGEPDTRDLDASIEESGEQEPIKVWKMPDGTLQISSGHRRVTSAKNRHQTEIEGYILDFVDQESVTKALLSANVHRDLSPIMYARMIEIYFRDIYGIPKERFWDDRPYGSDQSCYKCLGLKKRTYERYRSLIGLNENLQDFIETYDNHTWFYDEEVYRFDAEQQKRLCTELQAHIVDEHFSMTKGEFSFICAEITGKEPKIVVTERNGTPVSEFSEPYKADEDVPEEREADEPDYVIVEGEKKFDRAYVKYTKTIDSMAQKIINVPVDLTESERQLTMNALERLKEAIRTVEENLKK